MEPLVSILIPAFNAEEWIAYTLHSAIAQTWPRKEIIVVDDGSSDGTLAIARQFESDTVRVVSQTNQGAAAARNAAFALSHGDYIQWLDADDLLAPDKIARQMQALPANSSRRTLLSCAFGQFIYRYYRTEFAPSALWTDLAPREWLLRKMGQNVFMQTATWLVSRELTEAAGAWNTQLLGDDDGEYFCRVLLNSDNIRFVPEAKVYYRAAGSGSLSYVGHSSRKLEAQWRSMKLHIGYMNSLENSDRARAACVQYLQTLLIYFYPDRLDIVREAAEMARELGSELRLPQLARKYEWIRAIFGWKIAKRAHVLLPKLKWNMVRRLDKLLFYLQWRHSRWPQDGLG
jgi:glycosyltransferase involved in cell wall biosynthesis